MEDKLANDPLQILLTGIHYTFRDLMAAVRSEAIEAGIDPTKADYSRVKNYMQSFLDNPQENILWEVNALYTLLLVSKGLETWEGTAPYVKEVRDNVRLKQKQALDACPKS